MSGSTTPTTFTHTGKAETYTVPYTGLYDTAARGAQGGNGDRQERCRPSPAGGTPGNIVAGVIVHSKCGAGRSRISTPSGATPATRSSSTSTAAAGPA